MRIGGESSVVAVPFFLTASMAMAALGSPPPRTIIGALREANERRNSLFLLLSSLRR
jgi:hypothetical protein